jgi:hypothetical protein
MQHLYGYFFYVTEALFLYLLLTPELFKSDPWKEMEFIWLHIVFSL